MKHMRMRAELTPNKKKFTLVLEELSHVGKEFGPTDHAKHLIDGSYGSIVFMHNNVMMYVWDTTDIEFSPNWSCGVDWLTIPSKVTLPHRHKETIDVAYWPRIKELIEAYNAWGETQ